MTLGSAVHDPSLFVNVKNVQASSTGVHKQVLGGSITTRCLLIVLWSTWPDLGRHGVHLEALLVVELVTDWKLDCLFVFFGELLDVALGVIVHVLMDKECVIIVVPMNSTKDEVPSLVGARQSIELDHALLAAALMLGLQLDPLPFALDLIVV